MVVFRAFLAGLALALVAASVQAQALASPVSRYPSPSFGLSLGYGAPYGWGVDFSHLLTPSLDVTVGLGATITGAKVGVSTRYYFMPARQVSPFGGANLVYSTGLQHVTVSNSNSRTAYNTSGDYVVVNFKPTSFRTCGGACGGSPPAALACWGRWATAWCWAATRWNTWQAILRRACGRW